MSQINGRISQIIGPVIDVYFDVKGEDPEKVLPKIYDALRVKRPNNEDDLIIEVHQHIGEDTVRCVAMDNTEGLQRDLEVIPTGSPIVMPAGQAIGVSAAKSAMAIAWGDAWTNMIQPFWALPALGIAGLGAKDIMGYCLIVTIVSGLFICTGFLLF